ncbi:MAG: chemotaxis protein CheW [Gemmatimonadales bacterium]|jgi:chemotaxis signal transduction protein|nr:chemotaxis protein CheW [Gemmatimonadales bacterium]
MSGDTRAFLLVRSGGRPFGLGVEALDEVCASAPVARVPSHSPAVRGVRRLRDTLVPVVHLGALLDETACPEPPGEAVVLVRLAGRRVALEVDEAEVVRRERVVVARVEDRLPWSRAIAVLADSGAFVPLLDLAALEARLAQGETCTTTT